MLFKEGVELERHRTRGNRNYWSARRDRIMFGLSDLDKFKRSVRDCMVCTFNSRKSMGGYIIILLQRRTEEDPEIYLREYGSNKAKV